MSKWWDGQRKSLTDKHSFIRPLFNDLAVETQWKEENDVDFNDPTVDHLFLVLNKYECSMGLFCK